MPSEYQSKWRWENFFLFVIGFAVLWSQRVSKVLSPSFAKWLSTQSYLRFVGNIVVRSAIFEGSRVWISRWLVKQLAHLYLGRMLNRWRVDQPFTEENVAKEIPKLVKGLQELKVVGMLIRLWGTNALTERLIEYSQDFFLKANQVTLEVFEFKNIRFPLSLSLQIDECMRSFPMPSYFKPVLSRILSSRFERFTSYVGDLIQKSREASKGLEFEIERLSHEDTKTKKLVSKERGVWITDAKGTFEWYLSLAQLKKVTLLWGMASIYPEMEPVIREAMTDTARSMSTGTVVEGRTLFNKAFFRVFNEQYQKQTPAIINQYNDLVNQYSTVFFTMVEQMIRDLQGKQKVAEIEGAVKALIAAQEKDGTLTFIGSEVHIYGEENITAWPCTKAVLISLVQAQCLQNAIHHALLTLSQNLVSHVEQLRAKDAKRSLDSIADECLCSYARFTYQPKQDYTSQTLSIGKEKTKVSWKQAKESLLLIYQQRQIREWIKQQNIIGRIRKTMSDGQSALNTALLEVCKELEGFEGFSPNSTVKIKVLYDRQECSIEVEQPLLIKQITAQYQQSTVSPTLSGYSGLMDAWQTQLREGVTWIVHYYQNQKSAAVQRKDAPPAEAASNGAAPAKQSVKVDV